MFFSGQHVGARLFYKTVRNISYNSPSFHHQKHDSSQGHINILLANRDTNNSRIASRIYLWPRFLMRAWIDAKVINNTNFYTTKCAYLRMIYFHVYSQEIDNIFNTSFLIIPWSLLYHAYIIHMALCSLLWHYCTIVGV